MPPGYCEDEFNGTARRLATSASAPGGVESTDAAHSPQQGERTLKLSGRDERPGGILRRHPAGEPGCRRVQRRIPNARFVRASPSACDTAERRASRRRRPPSRPATPRQTHAGRTQIDPGARRAGGCRRRSSGQPATRHRTAGRRRLSAAASRDRPAGPALSITRDQKPRDAGAVGRPAASTPTRISIAVRSYGCRANGCVFMFRQSPDAAIDATARARMLSRRADGSFIHRPRAKRCRGRSRCPMVSYRFASRPSACVNSAAMNRSGRVTGSPTTASHSATARIVPGPQRSRVGRCGRPGCAGCWKTPRTARRRACRSA